MGGGATMGLSAAAGRRAINGTTAADTTHKARRRPDEACRSRNGAARRPLAISEQQEPRAAARAADRLSGRQTAVQRARGGGSSQRDVLPSRRCLHASVPIADVTKCLTRLVYFLL